MQNSHRRRRHRQHERIIGPRRDLISFGKAAGNDPNVATRTNPLKFSEFYISPFLCFAQLSRFSTRNISHKIHRI